MNIARRSCQMLVVISSLVLNALIASIVFGLSPAESVRIEAQFPSPSTSTAAQPFRNIAIDSSSGLLYVGSVNIMYSLNGNLSVVGSAITGPKWDNPGCYDTSTFNRSNNCNIGYNTGTETVSMTDNYNQVLVVDAARGQAGQLITCGSLFQGTCETRSLANVSTVTGTYWSDTSQFIASSNPSVPTVAFIAPGPGGADSLYVGTVDLGPGGGTPLNVQKVYPFRQSSCGASSRMLTYQTPSQVLRPYTNDDQTKFTFVAFSSAYAMPISVTYVAGFGLNGFSYFLTTQPDPSVATTSLSRIARVCQNDNAYNSYVDMTIVCKSGNRNYNVVRSAIVRQPGSLLASSLGMNASDYVLLATFYGLSDSALCVYKMKDIQSSFTGNLQLCFSASGTPLGPQYFNWDKSRCSAPSQNYAVPENYCGENIQIQGGTPLFVSNISVTATPIISTTFSNTNLTTIEATSVDNHTVVFMGTSDGRLMKMLLDSLSGASVYEVGQVSQSRAAFRSYFLLPPPRTFLYGLTSEKVYKMPVSDCDQYTTCSQCLSVMDPYCGWCTLNARCMNRLSCPDWSSNNHWQSKLTGLFNQCISITAIQPSNQTSAERATNLTLQTFAFPQIMANQSLTCVFGSDEMQSPAIIKSAVLLQCTTPVQVTGIMPSTDFLNVNLSVRLVPANVDMAMIPFTFFNCSVHSKCSECVSSKWGCRWCVHDNRCVDSLYTCSNVSVASQSLCPSLNSSDMKLLPSNVLLAVNITASNLPFLLNGEGGYTCIWQTTTDTVRIPANRVSSSLISCNSYTFISTDEIPQLSTLTVSWNSGFMIEGYVNVTVFSCPSMARQDCSTCRSLATNPSLSRYGCVWCNNQCQPNTSTSLSTCAPGCPLPIITSVNPTSTVIEGGTLVTINGTNLGYAFSSVQNVTVAGVLCTLLESQYVISVKIVCVTQRTAKPTSGSVQVTIQGQTVNWTDTFQYKDPQFTDIVPVRGPVAGGTLVTLYGTQLAAAGAISVRFGSAPCNPIPASLVDSQLICRTSPVNTTRPLMVTVSYDNSNTTSRSVSQSFEYVVDPVVTNVNPQSSSSFRSGGCHLTVSGTNLLSSLTATLKFIGNGSRTYSVEPVNRTESQLIYLSPTIDSSEQLPSVYRMSIEMDGVLSTRNLAASLSAVWTFVEDPKLTSFQDGTKQYLNELLILPGASLDTWCLSASTQPVEVVVLIGEEQCNVTTITPTELQCKAPSKQPPGLDSNGKPSSSILPRVKVIVGNGSLTFDLGTLSYSSSGVWIGIPLIVGIVGGVIFIAIILLIVFLARKSSAKEHDYKRLLGQFNQLERNVRDQCKQAFADLQMELTDLNKDLQEVGFPFQDYKTYTYKLLFQDNQPVMYRDRSLIGDKQIQQFHQLLSSKYFLLVFIRTLEAQQKNFTIQDRTKVASLLMIVLLDKMELAIEIIKVLLDDLIVRSSEKKLMLRRTESVVEKLLANWLSLCMYDYLQHQAAGKAFYTLYQAVKRQTEKGPIDAILGEATFSLSEQSLLRESIDAKQLTVTLFHSEFSEKQFGSEEHSEMMECKLLDCDSITQAKEKALDVIFAKVPFSKRPPADDVELQLKATSSSAGLPLNDEDATTKPEDGWKKINTLRHYSVRDGTTLIVVTGQRGWTSTEAGGSNLGYDNSEGVVRNVHGHLELQAGLSPSSMIRLNRTLSNEHIWHLVRHATDEGQNGVGRKAPRIIPEIFLTKLLQTKMSLQDYIDELVKSILKVNNSTPVAVKYLFDLFDAAAVRHGITDPEVTHNWKNNSLLLRFWANVIPNPHFVFDVNASDVVHTSLTSILSALMDSCTFSEYRPTKDSPASKLLFAKDVPRYRQLVVEFYSGIRDQRPITDEEMGRLMVDMSRRNVADFNLNDAVSQLFRYAHKYNAELIEALDSDPSSRKMGLANKFEEIDKQVVESVAAHDF